MPFTDVVEKIKIVWISCCFHGFILQRRNNVLALVSVGEFEEVA